MRTCLTIVMGLAVASATVAVPAGQSTRLWFSGGAERHFGLPGTEVPAENGSLLRRLR